MLGQQKYSRRQKEIIMTKGIEWCNVRDYVGMIIFIWKHLCYLVCVLHTIYDVFMLQ